MPCSLGQIQNIDATHLVSITRIRNKKEPASGFVAQLYSSTFQNAIPVDAGMDLQTEIIFFIKWLQLPSVLH